MAPLINGNSFEHNSKSVTNMTVMIISFLIILGTVVLFYSHARSEYFKEAAAAAASSPWTPLPRNITALSLCAQTDHNQTCFDTLKSIPSAPVEVYIRMTINASIQGMNQTLEKGKDHKNRNPAKLVVDSMSLEDCLEVIELAMESLDEAYLLSGVYKDRKANLKTLLSAAISYQVTCLDGAKEPKIKAIMFPGLENPINQLSNALAMVDSNVSNNHQSNDNTAKTGNDGETYTTFSRWFSPIDRRLLQEPEQFKPHAIVSLDANDLDGEYKTITKALLARPEDHEGRYIIHVKAGVYHESVTIEKQMVDVLMYGDGPKLTIIRGNKTTDRFTMYRTATFAVIGKGFVCKSMAFENNGDATSRGIAGVALRVQSDTAAFIDCRIQASKVSLHSLAYRQFFSGCLISGNRDILHGDSAMIIQNSTIMVKRSNARPKMITITSQGRLERHESTGFVIQNCTFKLDKETEPANSKPDIYLGRPRKPYSRTVVMESDLGNLIHPDGWTIGSDTPLQYTVQCIEYNNKGTAADTAERVGWMGFKAVKDKSEVQNYTVENFIQGVQWLEGNGITFKHGLSS